MNLTNISRQYLGINKMKIDLTTGTWQDNPGCPINITLVSTSDGAPGLFPQARIVSSIETPAFPFKLFGLRKQFKQQETIFYKIKHTSNNQIIRRAWGAKRIERAAGWGARF